jgi:hypothetical protein
VLRITYIYHPPATPFSKPVLCQAMFTGASGLTNDAGDNGVDLRVARNLNCAFVAHQYLRLPLHTPDRLFKLRHLGRIPDRHQLRLKLPNLHNSVHRASGHARNEQLQISDT